MFNLGSIHRSSFLIANQGTCEKQESFLLLLQGHLYDVLGKNHSCGLKLFSTPVILSFES
jgi:hypothetical protein